MEPEAAERQEPKKERRPRVEWAELMRRTLDFDVFTSVRSGGRRRVLAYLTAPGGVRAISRAPGIAHAACSAGPGAGASTAGVVLRPKQQLPIGPSCLLYPSGERGLCRAETPFPDQSLMVPSATSHRTRRSMLARREHGTRMRSTWTLSVVLLVLVAALGAHAEPPSFTLPGRKPDSREPWGAFLGRAAHMAIGIDYRVQHPLRVVFLDTVSLAKIMEEGKLGNPKRLSELVRLLRPDIMPVDCR
ncbi:hypothetical protein [Archangium sp.]|uniref:hypothetical protein n=1 Tax=Archangium sp. TaxID=1872627 RepID=UPI002D53B0B6|nr:hypothetical protein [Archangium sp.]HYO54061.1 hypothetical protein [Archangium sp.]